MTAMRALADEMQSSKYAHVERERRWLVDPASRPPLDGLDWVLIEDRYIRGTRMRLRRMSNSVTGERSLKLTKKYDSPDPLARPIVTAYLTEAEHALLSTLEADPLTKRRYSIAVGGFEWSLDLFAGPLEGLELLEIEAPDAQSLTRLTPPGWVRAEVSSDSNYEGGTLARRGLPKETTWRQS
jgi:CYTH domain-containing protein